MAQEYVPPTLTVDLNIFQVIDGELNILLIKRRAEPFKDSWALPGGYFAEGDETTTAVKKIAFKKGGLDIDKLGHVEQLYTFDTIARDPRGPAVSIAFLGAGNNLLLSSHDSSENPSFFPVNNLPKLAFDHSKIIDMAIERLRAKLEYSNIAFSFLPKNFTLAQLKSTYEAALGKEIDKRNFIKWYKRFEFIKSTGKKTEGGAHRPAELWTFKKASLEKKHSELF